MPEFQNQGVGSALIGHTKQLAAKAGYPAIALFGNSGYYRRFGFRPGEEYAITDSEGNFCEALLVMELARGALEGVSGRLCENPVFHVKDEDAAEFDKTFPRKQKQALPSQLFLGNGTVRPMPGDDFEGIYAIINDAARAYKGIIPGDCWHEPYLSRGELCGQIENGAVFYGYYVNGLPVGVMGIQDRGEVNLIRHIYVRTVCRKLGIGGKLLGVPGVRCG